MVRILGGASAGRFRRILRGVFVRPIDAATKERQQDDGGKQSFALHTRTHGYLLRQQTATPETITISGMKTTLE